MKNISLFALLFLFEGCFAPERSKDSISKWQSEYHELQVVYSAPWNLLPGFDTQKETLFGLIDKTNGASYVIKIAPDVSKERLSDETYYEAFKEMMLEENSKNKLLGEEDVDFHGSKFHRFELLMYTDKWGLLKHFAYVRRPGNFMTGVQISFPISEDAINSGMPKNLEELDKKITL